MTLSELTNSSKWPFHLAFFISMIARGLPGMFDVCPATIPSMVSVVGGGATKQAAKSG
jgi:hypothetical protein